jgi:hypothetical protein
VGQTADQIRDEIDNQRQELGDNLQELERKVKETVDWRAQFEQKPMLGLGIAFGAGLLLSVLTPSGDDKRSQARQPSNADSAYMPYAPYSGEGYAGQRREEQPSYAASSQQPRQRSPEMNEISETLDNIKGALLGLGATRLRSFLAEAVPGFHQEYEQARKQRNASPQTRIDPAPSTSGSGTGDAHATGSGVNQQTPEMRQSASGSSAGYMGSAGQSTDSANPSHRT